MPSGWGRRAEFPSLLIKKFIRRVLRLGSGSGPRFTPKEQHGIGREAISHGARKVCEVLQSHGYEAYVVGGAVRDLLLGLKPKDFDAATDASPEEVHKLFRRSRLIGRRFKLVHVMFEQPMGERFVTLALEQTDGRLRSGKSVSPAFLFAALLWHEVLAAWKKARERGQKPIPALFQAMDSVLDIQTDKLAIPRRFTAVMKEIWASQPRFEQRSGRRPFALLMHERFRAGYDFLVLRAASGEVPQELAQWWEKFQRADEEERQSMLLAPQPGDQRRRRRRRRRGSAAPPPDAAPA